VAAAVGVGVGVGEGVEAYKFMGADVGRDRVARVIIDVEQHAHPLPTMVIAA